MDLDSSAKIDHDVRRLQWTLPTGPIAHLFRCLGQLTALVDGDITRHSISWVPHMVSVRPSRGFM
ncbi:unnamed protein product [Dovyalis caffra]|uniref:Uncharacterized protein n=1 Tax=Dovyalis caffra TaxID=77055 RepID=A0AAV1R5V5_9ROSI|nr:unnamed protein product [Dovyalis caffra]